MVQIIDDDYEAVRRFRTSKEKEDIELKKMLNTKRKQYRHLIMTTQNKEFNTQ